MIYKLKDLSPRFGQNNYIAPNSVIIGDVITYDDVSIWFNAVVRGDTNRITIGKGSNIQDNTTVHVDHEDPVIIGENVTIGHNCVIHGCDIGDHCLIGMGSVILSGSIIPKDCIVAAGSVVNHHLKAEPCSLIAGAPAKVIKKLNEQYIQLLKDSNEDYLERIKYYPTLLKEVNNDEK